MTYYPGGKKKLGFELAETIYDVSMNISNRDGFKIKGYCEPFCGMLGVYQYIPDLFKDHKQMKYKAGDRNPYIIKLWDAIKRGWKPPTTCSKTEYYNYKDNDNKSLKALFVGFACALRGQFRSTYLEDRNLKTQSEYAEMIGNKIKQVSFKTGEYIEFSNLKGYIIYCDPPYKNTASFYSIGSKINTEFNYNNFQDWIEMMSENYYN